MSRSAYELGASGPEALPIAVGLLGSDDWTAHAKGAWIVRRVADRAGGEYAELARIVGNSTGREDPAERRRIAAEAQEWLSRH
jgi:hypothetical protein